MDLYLSLPASHVPQKTVFFTYLFPIPNNALCECNFFLKIIEAMKRGRGMWGTFKPRISRILSGLKPKGSCKSERETHIKFGILLKPMENIWTVVEV